MNCSSYSKNAMVLKVRGYTRFLTHSICHYKMIKRKILDYILDKINHALLELEKEYLFQGQTVLNVPAINYIKYYDKLIAGDITIKEIFDIFQYGKIQKHK